MPEERKLVTILFADVTGSTALGEGLDPEDLRALMARYYEHARRIVSGHGGTLEKFIGDAVMAIFGLPQAHSNDAERALATALEEVWLEADGRLENSRLLRLWQGDSIFALLIAQAHYAGPPHRRPRAARAGAPHAGAAGRSSVPAQAGSGRGGAGVGVRGASS